VYIKNTPEGVLDEAFLYFNFTPALKNLQAYLIQLIAPGFKMLTFTHFLNAMKSIVYKLGDN